MVAAEAQKNFWKLFEVSLRHQQLRVTWVETPVGGIVLFIAAFVDHSASLYACVEPYWCPLLWRSNIIDRRNQICVRGIHSSSSNTGGKCFAGIGTSGSRSNAMSNVAFSFSARQKWMFNVIHLKSSSNVLVSELPTSNFNKLRHMPCAWHIFRPTLTIDYISLRPRTI